jgi:hypothetical protein
VLKSKELQFVGPQCVSDGRIFTKKCVLEIQNVEWLNQIVECIGDAFVSCSLISTFQNLNIARNFTNG